MRIKFCFKTSIKSTICHFTIVLGIYNLWPLLKRSKDCEAFLRSHYLIAQLGFSAIFFNNSATLFAGLVREVRVKQLLTKRYRFSFSSWFFFLKIIFQFKRERKRGREGERALKFNNVLHNFLLNEAHIQHCFNHVCLILSANYLVF